MLPLDKLTDEAAEGFRKNGIDPDKLLFAVQLDLDLEGQFGETWAALDEDKENLYVISVSSTNAPSAEKRKILKNGVVVAAKTHNSFENCRFVQYDFTRLKTFYIENFVTSNRFQALYDGEHTQVIAYCTNAKKRKLVAFIDLLYKIYDKKPLTEEDPIFDLFRYKCPKCGKLYPDQDRRICPDCAVKSTVMKRVMKYFKPFWGYAAIILLCMLASSGLGLLSPWVSGHILLDEVINVNGAYHNIPGIVYIMVGIMFGLGLISVLIGIVQTVVNAHISTRVSLNMKLDIFASIQKLSLSFFNSNQTGHLITRVNSDAETIRTFFVSGVPQIIINGVTLIGLTVLTMMMNWRLTLIVFIPFPIIISTLKVMLPKLYRMYSMQWRRSSSMNSFLSDSLGGVRVVKAFAKESEETHRFFKYNSAVFKTSLQVNLVSLTVWPLISLMLGLSSNMIWLLGGLNVMGDIKFLGMQMSYGEFVTYFNYAGMLFGPINFFTNLTNMLTQTLNSASRMFEVLDAVPEIYDAPDCVKIDEFKGDIRFDEVNFHYQPARPILKDINFHIKPGDHVGLVGHTGAGKSTIANLVNRLYDVVSGSISIDGVDVKKIAGESMRKNIAIVSQEIFLFRGTIADNIRYARPDATMEEVIEAARIANAHDFIMRLPDGYETEVGTGCRHLSGGQNQRLSIARAILLNPTILILDEATAAMDTETERLIQDALTRLVQGRTTITIAHRLSTLKDCNYLYVIENGEIAEHGTHRALLKKKGIYFKLYTLQNEAMKKVLIGT